MKYLLLCLIPLGILTGCYSTNITGYWSAVDQPEKKYKKILVLGLMKDSLMRQRMELHIAGDLHELGYVAVTASDEFDALAFTRTEDRDALLQFSEKGIDAVLTIVLLDQRTEGFFLPGSMYHLLTSYYSSLYYGLYAPDWYREGVKYAWETSFYDIASGSRLYAVQTTTFDPQSIEKLSHEYGKVVVKCMQQHKVIRRQR
ncbi:hypothetical protein [Chitinophaga sp. XS-30]|uniref:hypothetical protein n=1 Tax=Chitinophaga sp. XS-30 TaxID=2604421 RepID=UPI0011DD51A8|nr:hypothetical protein [Chitinophaga sp. XS-30]QEH43002.1 hypothetical protein FW415_19865 [Chitinophaga sp. XS-30]